MEQSAHQIGAKAVAIGIFMQDKSLKQLLESVGVECRRVIDGDKFKGVALYDSATGKKLHNEPVARYCFGMEIYQQRLLANG